MGDKTKIEWTDATWNTLRGCTRVSRGCMNCYAEKMSARFAGPGGAFEGVVTNTTAGPRWTGDIRFIEEKLDQPIRWRKPRRIFVNSMSDLFHEKVSDDIIKAHFDVMHQANHHIYQVLTKRPERMSSFIMRHGGPRFDKEHPGPVYPVGYEHVWLGTSVEDQHAANVRIPRLQEIPARVRFLSMEPLLGPVDLKGLTDGIGWIIVGGESGPGARPMHPEWVQDICNICFEENIPFFFKQWGVWAPGPWDGTPDTDSQVTVYRSGHKGVWSGDGPHPGFGVVKMYKGNKHDNGALLEGEEYKGMPR